MPAGQITALAERLKTLLHAGDTIWWGQATAEPLTLTRAVVVHRHALAQGGRLSVFVGIGASDTLLPEQADVIDFFGYTASGSHRVLAQTGVLDVLPSHYSHLPHLIRDGTLPADVVLVQVSPPDEQGRHSLGLAREYLTAALEKARVVIGEVNPAVPWTYGSVYLKANDFAMLVDAEHAPVTLESAVPGPTEQAIARHIGALVQDGATLQVGIGKVPEAVLNALHNRRDLGLHSGAIGDSIAALAESGALTNARKGRDAGVGIAGILMGGERLRCWAHRNPALALRGTDYTHNAEVLASLNQLVAINSAVEIDLTGQVNAEVASGSMWAPLGARWTFCEALQAAGADCPLLRCLPRPRVNHASWRAFPAP